MQSNSRLASTSFSNYPEKILIKENSKEKKLFQYYNDLKHEKTVNLIKTKYKPVRATQKMEKTFTSGF